MPSISARLSTPPEPALALLCTQAEALGAQVTQSAGQAEIRAVSASVSAESLEAALRITVSAETDEDLHGIRDLLDAFADMLHLPAPEWQAEGRGGAAARNGSQKTRLTRAQLVSVKQISPSYKRVRLAGDFQAFANGGLHFRLLLGPLGAELPQTGPDGDLIWPGGIEAWHRPPYTVRALSPAADLMDFDIFLHDGGRVTEWTEDLRPGDEVALTGPGGRGVRQAGWLGMVGDETALPVILRAIEAAGPETRGQALILVPDLADAQALVLPAGLQLEWVPRSAGLGLMDLMRRLTPPEDHDRFVFFAGERAEAAEAREHALALGLAQGEFLSAVYWTEGWEPPETQRPSRATGSAAGN